MQGRERELLLGLSVGIGALVWLGGLFAATPLTPTNEGRDIDGVWYAAIARDPGLLLRPPGEVSALGPGWASTDPVLWPPSVLAHWAPFCWRVLTPLLVHAMNLPVLEGFLWLNFAGQTAAAVLLWALLRRLGVAPGLAGAGVALHLTSFWGPRFAFWSPAHIETMSMVLTLALLLAMVSGRSISTAALFVFAALQREQLLTLALFHLLWLRSARGWSWPRALAVACAAVLPGALVQLALRTMIEPINSHALVPSILFYHQQRWDHVVESRGLYLVRFVVGTLHTLGGLPILCLLGGPPLWRALRREGHWLVMALVTWLLVWVGGVDNERRVFYAFPLLLAPLLMHWGETPLARRTLPLLIWVFAGHVTLNLILINLSSPEMYGRTAISVFLPHGDLPRHVARLGAVWAAMALGGGALLRRRRGETAAAPEER